MIIKAFNITNDRSIILKISLFVFIISLPFELIFTSISFFILVITILIVLRKRKLDFNLNRYKLVLLIPFLFLQSIIFPQIVPDYSFSFSHIDTQLLMFFVPLAIILLDRKGVNKISMIKTTFVWSISIFCIVAFITLFYKLLINFEHRMDYNFIQTSMYHFHYPYDVLYINIAYTILIFSKKFRKLHQVTIGVLFFVFTLLSGVRLGLFLFIFISIVYFFCNIKRVLSIKFFIFLFAIVTLGLVLIKTSRYTNDKFFDSLDKIGFNTKKYVSDIGEDYHKMTLRQRLWSTAIEAHKRNDFKLIGYGPNGSKPIIKSIYLKRGFKDKSYLNSHNQYLTTLVDGGYVGLAMLVLIFIFSIIISIKNKSLENVLIVILIMASFLTESMLERQKGVVIFSLFLSISLIQQKKVSH